MRINKFRVKILEFYSKMVNLIEYIYYCLSMIPFHPLENDLVNKKFDYKLKLN